jgi:transcriptional regulator with XRE-family HTH domain
MTFVLDDVNTEYENCLGEVKENVFVPRNTPDLEQFPPDLTRPGLRFHYLLLQLKEKGWTQGKIASAIGCHQTLVSDWQRADFAGRKGVGADIIDACMSGPLKLHYDYFFSDYSTLPEGRRDFVELPDGTMRQARPGEADALLFPIDLDRARNDRRIRELEAETKASRTERAESRQQIQAMSQQLAQLTQLVGQLTGTTAPGKKTGSR